MDERIYHSLQYSKEKEKNDTTAKIMLEKAKIQERRKIEKGYSFQRLDDRTIVLTKDIKKSREKFQSPSNMY